MISPVMMGLAEDAFHLVNPKSAKENLRHMRTGVLHADWKGLVNTHADWTGMGASRTAWKGFAKQMGHSLRAPWDLGFKGTLLTTLPLAAWNASQAPRGHMLSAGLGSSLSYGLAAAPGAFLGGSLGAWISSTALGPSIQRGLEKTVQRVAETGRRTAGIRMGGDYRDTQAAYTMRQRAALDLSQSVLNARQYLGAEARMLHS